MNYKSNNGHILLLNRSFWPDIEATGQFLTELCGQLAIKYKVTVIAGRSYYTKNEAFCPGRVYSREIFNGIEILRVHHTIFWKRSLAGRMMNWLTYGFLTFIVALRLRPKVIISCTDPPFLGIIAMAIGALKSIPFIYYCMDLYPDFALEIGELKQGFVSYLFDCLNRKSLRKANFIVSLGASMEDRLKTKGVSNEHIKTIPCFVDTSIIKPVDKADNPLLEKLGLKNKFIIMYSGNIGLSQDFSSILQSVAVIKEQGSFCLVFIGEGAGKESLEKEVKSLGLKNVLFFPYQPKDALPFSLGMVDLHIVPLKKGMAGASVPSKVYAILAAAKPYLAIADRDAEPSRIVNEYGCGLWALPGDIKAISQAISWALAHQGELEKMGRMGRQVAVEKFDKNVVIREWFDLLDRNDAYYNNAE